MPIRPPRLWLPVTASDVARIRRCCTRNLAAQLKAWIAGKPDLKSDEALFPISGRVPGGTDRKTHKMMRIDLEAARKKVD